MRTYQHIIDTKAVKKTMQSIPDYWVIRELTERDYGIDLMIEIFSEFGEDDNGHTLYDSTGHVCYLQIKGTNTELNLNQDEETVSFQIDKKSLLYVEKFTTPFLLIRACTLEQSNSIYFLWLQRYILEVLDINIPDWRTNDQESFAVRIPITNKLPDNFEKIEKIASRIKYIEEHAEFYDRYSLMKDAYEGMVNQTFTNAQYQQFIIELKRIRTFDTLLSKNNCQVDVEGISNLIDFISGIQNGTNVPTSIDDFPDPLIFNLEMLLNDNFMRMALENMIAENESDTVY